MNNFIDSTTDFFISIIDALNPANADFSSAAGVIIYVIKLILILGIAALTVFSVLNIKKFFAFVSETLLELKKVSWLTRKETIRYSLIVIISMALFTLFLLGTDKTLLFIRNLLILPSN